MSDEYNFPGFDLPLSRASISAMMNASGAMARALCLVEWSHEMHYEANECPCCGWGPEKGHSHWEANNIEDAEVGSVSCELDAALTAAGLDAAARQAVRDAQSRWKLVHAGPARLASSLENARAGIAIDLTALPSEAVDLTAALEASSNVEVMDEEKKNWTLERIGEQLDLVGADSFADALRVALVDLRQMEENLRATQGRCTELIEEKRQAERTLVVLRGIFDSFETDMHVAARKEGGANHRGPAINTSIERVVAFIANMRDAINRKRQ